MPRARGLPRWAFLLLTFVAIAAVAMIPRGIVRTTEASQLGTTDAAEVLRYESPSSQGAELPGVRAVVSREEREVGPDAAPDAALRGAPDATSSGGIQGDAVTDLLPAAAHHRDPGHATRAPPTSI